MKRLIPFSAVLFLLLLTMTLDCYSLLRHMTKEELILKSQDVIHGVVKEIKSDWNLDHSEINTYVKLAVLDVFKGEPRKEVVFEIFGGSVGDSGYRVEDQPELEVGMEIIIHAFLKKDGYLGIRGLVQGVYFVNNGIVDNVSGELDMTLEQFRNFVVDFNKK